MLYEKIGSDYRIYMEEGENELAVLRALVKASFELASATVIGLLHSNDEIRMTDEMTERFISLPPRHRSEVVSMNYVRGRQCKTYIQRIGDGQFSLSGFSYERGRGTPEPLFARANEIVSGAEQRYVPVSDAHIYKGESLTIRLKECGFERKPSEDDFEFRKRVFPDFYRISPNRAMEFLMGGDAAEWDEMDTMLAFSITMGGKKTKQELVEFAEGFNIDPLERRAEIQATPIN